MRLNTAFESPTLATYLLHRIGTPENVSGSETVISVDPEINYDWDHGAMEGSTQTITRD